MGPKDRFKDILKETKRALNKKKKPTEGGLYSEFVANIGADAAKVDRSAVQTGDTKRFKPKSAWFKLEGITNLFWPRKGKLNYDMIRKGRSKNMFSKFMPKGFEDGGKEKEDKNKKK